MDRMMSKLWVICNSGAKRVRLIHSYGSTVPKTGDKILVSVIDVAPRSKIARGKMCKALLVHTIQPFKRLDNSIVKMQKNCVILLKENNDLPLGTRISGPVPFEITKKYDKVASIAAGVY